MVPNLINNGAATGLWVQVPGGRYVVAVTGTFSGATLALEFLGPDGVTALAVASGSLTAAGSFEVSLPEGYARMTVTGGPPSGIYAGLGLIR